MLDKLLEKFRKKSALKATAVTPLALSVAACGGSREPIPTPDPTPTPLPIDEDDDGVTTTVVLDYYTGDSGYHGDFVENTVAQNTDTDVVGVDREGRGRVSDTDNLLLEVNTDHEPEVINMSTGARSVVQDRGVFDSYLPELAEVSYNLWTEGVVVVGAAGNEGSYGVSASRGSSVFQLAIGSADEDGIESYSNYHPKVIDFYIDGFSEPTAYEYNGTTYMLELQGTSFAAPRVSAMVAELIEHDPDLTMSEIRTLLEYNSEYLEHDDGAGNEFVYQYLSELVQYDHVIDTRVIVEAGFELYMGRNPNQAELNHWVEQIDLGNETYETLEVWFSENTQNLDEVASVELAQAYYHWNFHRESTDLEVVDRLVDIEAGVNVVDSPFSFMPEDLNIVQTPTEIIA